MNYRPVEGRAGRDGARVAVIGAGPSGLAARFAEQLAASPRLAVDPADLDALRSFGWQTTAEAIAGSVPART